MYRAESTFRRRRALWGANGVEVKGQRRACSCGHKALWGTKSIRGTFQAPRCVHTAHFELCKSFYQIKTNWTHYIISLFEKIKNNFLYFWWTTFLFADVSTFQPLLKWPFSIILKIFIDVILELSGRRLFYIGSTCSSYCFIENYTQGNMMKSLNKIKYYNKLKSKI